MRVKDVNEGRFPSEQIGNQYGGPQGEVDLSRQEVYEAIARFALEKKFGRGTPRTVDFSISAFPNVLASHVVLGAGVRAKFWDGYTEVVLLLLPGSGS